MEDKDKIIKNLTSEVFDLKAKLQDVSGKLVESEKEIKEWVAVRDDKNKVINKQTEKINQLKQKLAEYEKVMEKHDCESVEKLNGRLHRYDQYEIKFLNMEEEIKELKQKLTEKDEQIERRIAVYEKQFIEQTNDNYELKQQLAENEEVLKYYEKLLKRQCNECKNQDKISFAVEKLEEVKHYAQHIQGGLINYIDNQIKELKKGSEQNDK